jgi:G:T-mismatch repair DNA endonuclease (very short patch repair protein)
LESKKRIRRKPKQLPSKSELEHLYVKERKTLQEIGKIYHVNLQKIRKLLVGYGIKIASRGAQKGHITTAITRKRIGVKNKITTKRFWKSMTESQKQKTGSSKTWFTKGQTSHNKGKKPTLKTRKRMSASATLRFQTQKHPHQGTHRSVATKKLLREARLRQKPMKNTVPEKLMRKMLKDVGIKFEEQIGIKEPPCQPDFFIQPNILIFTDGDRPHANPKPHLIPSRGKKIIHGHKPDEILWRDVTAKDMWARDRRITRGLKKEGYKVLRFWHSELETEKEKCLQKILKAVK